MGEGVGGSSSGWPLADRGIAATAVTGGPSVPTPPHPLRPSLPPQLDDGGWVSEYLRGAGNEMYEVPVPKDLEGLTYAVGGEGFEGVQGKGDGWEPAKGLGGRHACGG